MNALDRATLYAAADRIFEAALDRYPHDVFPKPTTEDYAAINALLLRERGHHLDRIAADCMRRAYAACGVYLREMADDQERSDG